MARRCIGIDPGKTGAVALVENPWDGTRPKEPRVVDTPVLVTGEKGKLAYDPQGMRAILVDMIGGEPDVLVVLETQQAMPKQGLSSTFTTGMGYGLWIGLLAGLQIPYRTVRPDAWKKVLMAGQPRTAQACVEVALRYYPRVRDLLVGPRGGLKDGRADALLLAHFVKSGH
jgi:hypothetical protein